MRQSEAIACETLRRARDLAPHLEAALAAGRPENELSHHGLIVREGEVRPDWVELTTALGEGPLTIAVVTVGGLDDLRRAPCVDHERIETWTRRVQQLNQLDPCNAAVLGEAMVQVLGELRDRCTCAPVDPITASRLGTRTQRLAPALSARLKTWSDEPNVCRPTGGTEASPAPAPTTSP